MTAPEGVLSMGTLTWLVRPFNVAVKVKLSTVEATLYVVVVIWVLRQVAFIGSFPYRPNSWEEFKLTM